MLNGFIGLGSFLGLVSFQYLSFGKPFLFVFSGLCGNKFSGFFLLSDRSILSEILDLGGSFCKPLSEFLKF
jgi:hypothetical protein